MNILVHFDLDTYGATIQLDGRTLSQYSELNSYLNDDFITWADRFFEMIDEEAQNDYELLLEGMPFHYCILKEMVSESRYCQKLSFSQVKSVIPMMERIREIETLCAKYHVPGFLTCPDKLVCESSEPEAMQALWPELTLVEHGYGVRVRVCAGVEETRMFSNEIFVVSSDRSRCTNRGRRSIIEIAEQDRAALEEYLNCYELRNAYLKKSSEALQATSLCEKDELALKGIITDQPQYYIPKLPSNMDILESVDLECCVVPMSFPQELLKVEIGNPSILSLERGKLYAKEVGESSVRFVDADGRELSKQNVQVVRHQYVEKIMINTATPVFSPNSEGQLSIFTYPEGAEDAEQLHFHLSNKSVAVVYPSGKVVTINPGVCRLTVSAKNVSESYDIIVMESVQSVSISPENSYIMSDETQMLRCEIIPSKALVEEIEWSVDNQYSATLDVSSDGKTCTVHPSGRLQFVTNITVTCKAGEKEASSVIQVKPVNKREFLQVTCILATVCAVLLCFLSFLDLAWYIAIVCCFMGMANNRVQDKTYKNCLIVNVFVFIGMIIATAAWSNAFH